MSTPMARPAAIVTLLVLSACALVAPPASSPARAPMTPRNGLEVIGAMRRAYPSRQLVSLAFTVTTTEHRATSSRSSSARVVARLPGRYRETRQPSSTRTGSVRDHHRLALFERGRVIGTTRRVDLATLIAYDVFAQSIDTTIMWLDSSIVRFGLARRDRFDGRDVWVVGAEPDDARSAQFWVDADLWRVVRVIQPDPRDGNDLLDMRFTAFAEHRGVPLPMKMLVYRDGALVQTRAISELSINPRVPASAFDLSRW
jgi:hypothetical protein